MLTRAALILVLLAGSCANERKAVREVAEAASSIASTAAVARATIQRFAPAADPLSKLSPQAQAKAQLTEAIVVTVSDAVGALLAYLAARRAAAAAADMGAPVDAGAP
jgi:hypothetical protein